MEASKLLLIYRTFIFKSFLKTCWVREECVKLAVFGMLSIFLVLMFLIFSFHELILHNQMGFCRVILSGRNMPKRICTDFSFFMTLLSRRSPRVIWLKYMVKVEFGECLVSNTLKLSFLLVKELIQVSGWIFLGVFFPFVE